MRINPFAHIQDPTARTLTFALEDCMKTKMIDQVRTSDILERSGVSRSTFYRHYRDKYDMINKNYQRILDRTLDEIGGASTYNESVRSIFDVLRTAPEFYKNALSSNEPDGLRQYIYRQSYENHKRLLSGFGVDMEDSVNQMLLTEFLYGTIRIMVVWVENGMKEDNDQILDCLYELMPDAFRKCFFVHYV